MVTQVRCSAEARRTMWSVTRTKPRASPLLVDEKEGPAGEHRVDQVSSRVGPGESCQPFAQFARGHFFRLRVPSVLGDRLTLLVETDAPVRDGLPVEVE